MFYKTVLNCVNSLNMHITEYFLTSIQLKKAFILRFKDQLNIENTYLDTYLKYKAKSVASIQSSNIVNAASYSSVVNPLKISLPWSKKERNDNNFV